MLANEDVTAHDRDRLALAAGDRYGKVDQAWRVTAEDKPAVVGLCSQVGIVLTDDDTVRLAFDKVGARVVASGTARVLQTTSTSVSVDFGDEAAAEEFDIGWNKAGPITPAPQPWSSGLALLSGVLLFLAVVVLVAGVSDAAVLFAHSRKGLVSDGFGGTTDGRVHPQTAVAFAVLVGSVVSAAVLAWCGVVGKYLLQRLEPASAEDG